MPFYTYLYLRDDGTPYYVGKGSEDRAYQSRKGHRPPKNLENIIIQEHECEENAFTAEIFLISYYGRKDLNTGCLQNRTDGGTGHVGGIAWNRGKSLTPEHVTALKLAQRGKKKCRSSEHAKKISLNKKLWWEQKRKLGISYAPRPQTSESLKKHYANLSDYDRQIMRERTVEAWKRRKAGINA